MAAGAVGYLQKPINNDELLGSIHLALGEAAVASQSPAA